MGVVVGSPSSCHSRLSTCHPNQRTGRERCSYHVWILCSRKHHGELYFCSEGKARLSTLRTRFERKLPPVRSDASAERGVPEVGGKSPVNPSGLCWGFSAFRKNCCVFTYRTWGCFRIYVTEFMYYHISRSIRFHRVNKKCFWTSGCYVVKCVGHGHVLTRGWGGVRPPPPSPLLL